MKNPLDSYLEEKTAGFMGDMGRGAQSAARALPGTLGQAAVGAAAGGAVGLAGAGLGFAAKKIGDAIMKRQNFRQMLAYSPDLQEHHEANPKLFNQMYSSLYTANPAFGSDPLIAGSYMRRMVDSPDQAGGMLREAVDSHRPGSESLVGKMSLEGAKMGLKPKDPGRAGGGEAPNPGWGA